MNDLTELKALLDQMTPAPWAWGNISDKDNGYIIGTAYDETGEMLSGRIGDGVEFMGDTIVCEFEAAVCNYDDPDGIVWLRNNAERLIADLEAANARIAELEAQNRGLDQALKTLEYDVRRVCQLNYAALASFQGYAATRKALRTQDDDEVNL